MYSYLPWTVVFLYCKKTCLTSWQQVLHFSICFAFPALWEINRKTWQKKKQLDKKITDYLLYLLWLALQAHKNMAQLISTLSDYILIMVGFASDTLWVDKKSSLHVNLKAYLWEVWRERWCSWWRNTDLLHRLRERKTKQPSQYWIGW